MIELIIMYMLSYGVNICATVITAIIFVAAFMGKNYKEKIFHLFFYLVLFSLCGVICELMAGIPEGIPGKTYYYVIMISDYAAYVFGALGLSVVAEYLYEYIKPKTSVSKKPVYAVFIISGILILLAAYAHFDSNFIWLDDNNHYRTGPYFSLTYLLYILSLAICIGFTLRYIKVLLMRERIVLLIYLMVPIFCYAVEYFVEGLWISQFGAASALLLIYITLQVHMMQKIKGQEAELTENRIAIMLSQIQPHFLNNSLNTIAYLYEDNEEARDALLFFSEYMRTNLNALSQKSLIPFEKELEHTKQYLLLEQLRFEDYLQVEYDLKTKDFMLPVLTLQPIVENAVKHGLTEKIGGGKVLVQTTETDEYFVIKVIDDGVGFDYGKIMDGEGDHTGISNVRNRLSAMCGGRLTVESAVGKGTTAIIEIPKDID